jgi:threonine dehydrogenase-like Zn-dependent dehydrogenase
MRALVFEGYRKLSLVDLERPVVNADEALVKVLMTGVCGTDTKIVNGKIPTEPPLILGHEIIGIVEKAASGGLVEEGTRVLVNPSPSCGRCTLCRAGRAQLCLRGGRMGMDAPGGFVEYLSVPDERLHIVPEHISLRDAVPIQVLGTCVHAQNLISIKPGQLAVVIGLGVPGFMHLQVLRARGVRVVAVTRSIDKLKLAEALGADSIATPDEAREVVAALSDGVGADLVVESAGTTDTFALGIELAAVGGQILVYGVLTGSSSDLPLQELYRKELLVTNSRGAMGNDYDEAIALVDSGKVAVSALVSAVHRFEAAPEVLLADQPDPSGLKIAFEIR